VRDTREILSYRASLVLLLIKIKNKVHSILSKNGINIKYFDIFSKKAMLLTTMPGISYYCAHLTLAVLNY